MKVILFHEYTTIYGGTEYVIGIQHRELLKVGTDVVLFRYDNTDFESNNMFYKLIILCQVLSGRYLCKDYQLTINYYRPDIIHFHNIFNFFKHPIWDRVSCPESKIILHLHNYYPLCLNSFFIRRNKYCQDCNSKNSWVKGIMSKCYGGSILKSLFVAIDKPKPYEWVKRLGKVSLLIAVSKLTADKYLSRGISKNKINIIPNPIEPHKHNSLNKGNYIMYLGNIRKEKGINLFIQSALKFPLLKFIAVGDGPELKKLSKQFSNIENLIFTGYKSGAEKADLIRNSRFLFAPSLCAETFGLTILEAYSYGKPVLTTASGAIKDLFVENQTGRLFKNYFSVKEFWDELDVKYLFYQKYCESFILNYSTEKFVNSLLSAYDLVK